MKSNYRLGLLCLLIAGTSACVSQTVRNVDAVQAAHAERELAPHELLNVGIASFEPGLPESAEKREKKNIEPAVREAESKFLPVMLGQTLRDTGYWGAVRVVPEPVLGSDLNISGMILESTGEVLTLKIQAVDATGRRWLDKTYTEIAAEMAYTDAEAGDAEPFQDLFDTIANDLLNVRRTVDAAGLRRIQRVAWLRFARDLSPQRFDQYLKRDANGQFDVARLPPRGDPLLERVSQIRERDEALVDTLDMHYGGFQQSMESVYFEWRKASYREALALRKLKKSSLWRKIAGAAVVAGSIVAGANSNSAAGADAAQLGIIGGAYLFKSGMDKGAESKIHVEALKELNTSLAADLKPQIVDLEGKTITLTGSAEEQYEQWRELLRQMYAQETGDTGESP